jgi:O-antigen ligase/polysaccharide polymerase Wzy-like membrane protein
MADLLSAAGMATARLSRAATLRIPWLALATLALVAGTGFAGGGYFPGSWGWPTLAAGWAAALALLVDERSTLGRLGSAYAALLAALAAWVALGALWSVDVTQTLHEAERTAVYVSAVLAALLWARRDSVPLLHGVWIASVLLCGWALVTRVVPDRFGVVDPISGYRLSGPIGYWNSLGLLAAIGILLGLGLSARAATTLGRAAGAASVPPLAATLYFTFSRGAWIALALGLAATVAIDRRRLQLLVTLAATGGWSALCVWRAAVSPALTTYGSALTDMSRQGHRFAIVVLAASAASAVTAVVAAKLEPGIHLGPRLRRGFGWAVGALALAAAVVLFVTQGSPWSLAHRGWDNFSSGGVQTTGSLNNRLFHLSGNGRTGQWSVAWRDVKAHPLLGSGAGTFEFAWFQDRKTQSKVRDAHNLYIETLAELGPLGLALLAAALVLPLVAGVRNRDRPLAFAAFGAYVAFLVHAAVDWDWEIASVTLAALLCGAALLPTRRRPFGFRLRQMVLAASVVLVGVGVYTLAAEIPVSRLRAAAARGDWAAAERDARRAAAVAPWSAEPWFALGEAELAAGRLPQAQDALLKATARSPRSWAAWLDLAKATSGTERADALARAEQLDPLGPEIAAFRQAGP